MSARPLHVAVFVNEENRIVVERTFAPGANVTVGGPATDLVVPGWQGPTMLLISGGDMLKLEPGMRVNMCDDQGGNRIEGTFDELLASGVEIPIPIQNRRMTVRVTEGVSVFAKYLAQEASDSEGQ